MKGVAAADQDNAAAAAADDEDDADADARRSPSLTLSRYPLALHRPYAVALVHTNHECLASALSQWRVHAGCSLAESHEPVHGHHVQ